MTVLCTDLKSQLEVQYLLNSPTIKLLSRWSEQNAADHTREQCSQLC